MIRRVAVWWIAGACFAQTLPLRERVLILVNERMRDSVEVGEYYAQRRGIPVANLVRLKTNTAEVMPMAEYQEQIERPLRKLLDANGGALKRKIVYIVPVYGIPVKASENFAVDSLISYMYAGHEQDKPPLKNLYAGATGSRPPHFAEWSDGPAAANGFKMFAVTRLDGPGAAIAKGLVDKAIEGEKTVTRKTGVAYFDYQGHRSKNEWQWAVDEEVRDGAERARALGMETVLHTQAKTACHALIAPETQHLWDAEKQRMVLSTHLSKGGLSFPLPGLSEAEFSAKLENVQRGMEGSVTLTLASADGRGQVRFFYPFVPFREYDQSAEAVVEKVVDGAVAARAAVRMAANAQVVNGAGELTLSVKPGRIAAYRNGQELVAAEDRSGKELKLASAGLSAGCWTAAIRELRVGEAWHDTFTADSSAKYRWQITPAGGLNAMWVWGWYSQAPDSYRFLPGAVGAQLTSYTALRMRTPVNADPKKRSYLEERWGGNWVPRMLEEGVTATWGAVAEPYATYYARGPNVFDHLWAGYNFGDSFYIAQNALRWVMVAVGDPLYSPVGMKGQ